VFEENPPAFLNSSVTHSTSEGEANKPRPASMVSNGNDVLKQLTAVSLRHDSVSIAEP
jgi:hypothetical protein